MHGVPNASLYTSRLIVTAMIYPSSKYLDVPHRGGVRPFERGPKYSTPTPPHVTTT